MDGEARAKNLEACLNDAKIVTPRKASHAAPAPKSNAAGRLTPSSVPDGSNDQNEGIVTRSTTSSEPASGTIRRVNRAVALSNNLNFFSACQTPARMADKA